MQLVPVGIPSAKGHHDGVDATAGNRSLSWPVAPPAICAQYKGLATRHHRLISCERSTGPGERLVLLACRLRRITPPGAPRECGSGMRRKSHSPMPHPTRRYNHHTTKPKKACDRNHAPDFHSRPHVLRECPRYRNRSHILEEIFSTSMTLVGRSTG